MYITINGRATQEILTPDLILTKQPSLPIEVGRLKYIIYRVLTDLVKHQKIFSYACCTVFTLGVILELSG